MQAALFYKRLFWVFLGVAIIALFLQRVDFPHNRFTILLQGLVNWVIVMSVAGAGAAGIAVISIRSSLAQIRSQVVGVSTILQEAPYNSRVVLVLKRYLLASVGIGGVLSGVYVYFEPARQLPVIIVPVGLGAILFLTLSVFLTVLLLSSLWFLSGSGG